LTETNLQRDSRSDPTARGSRRRRERVTFLVFGEPLIGEEEISEVVDTLRSGWIGTGPKTKMLEERFATYVQSDFALAVSSCTAGLHLALDVLGIGHGDEVITSPMTFAATANAIVHCGATPVFADVDRSTMNIDVRDVERKISPRTKAILPIHMAGRPCDMEALRRLARARNLFIVADAAHAIETRYRLRPVSMWADLSVYSFYATKNLTTAEGGMVTTSNPEWADAIAVRRLHGLSKDAWRRYSTVGSESYETLYPGYKYNLTDLQASLGLHQLAVLDERWQIRDRHWHNYRAAFDAMDGIVVPTEDPDPRNRHARHLFVILLELENLNLTRAKFIARLRDARIGTGIHFSPVHLHKYYRNHFGFCAGDYPHAEWIGERTVSLPLSAKLTDDDVADVVRAIARILGARRKRRRVVVDTP
jgi:dTDP-4-amino-4,6-dideoxygalactose transaminase